LSASGPDRRRRKPASTETPAPRTSARTAALALLGRRDYSSAELADKLEARGHTQEQILDALGSLRDAGLVDDRRVAEAHARTSSRVKSRGRYRVGRELQARGIPKDIIGDVLAGLDPRAEAEAIARVLDRKRWPARPTPADRRRMFQHLLRRGFSADAIGRAMGGRSDEDG